MFRILITSTVKRSTNSQRKHRRKQAKNSQRGIQLLQHQETYLIVVSLLVFFRLQYCDSNQDEASKRKSDKYENYFVCAEITVLAYSCWFSWIISVCACFKQSCVYRSTSNLQGETRDALDTNVLVLYICIWQI